MEKKDLENWVIDLMRLSDRVLEKRGVSLASGEMADLSLSVEYSFGALKTDFYCHLKIGGGWGIARALGCGSNRDEDIQKFYDDASDILLGNANIFIREIEEKGKKRYEADVTFPLRDLAEKDKG